MNHTIKKILIIIALALFNTGCEKDPASSSDPIPDGLLISYPDDYLEGILTVEIEGEEDDHEDHEDEGEHIVIEGFQLVLEHHDAEDHDHDDEDHDEYVYRQLGLAIDGLITIDVGETLEFSVHFLDSSGNELEDHEDHEDHDDEDHEDHGMIIEITGVSVGTTSFQIKLMHDGHPDFTSVPITVTVDN